MSSPHGVRDLVSPDRLVELGLIGTGSAATFLVVFTAPGQLPVLFIALGSSVLVGTRLGVALAASLAQLQEANDSALIGKAVAVRGEDGGWSLTTPNPALIALLGRDPSGLGWGELIHLDELRRRADHDPLTALPNRSTLQQHLQHSLRPGDLVARFGGDEFVICCPGVSEPSQAALVVERLHATVAPALLPHGRDVGLDLSIGVAIATTGEDATDLLERADVAMYADKRRAHRPGRVPPTTV